MISPRFCIQPSLTGDPSVGGREPDDELPLICEIGRADASKAGWAFANSRSFGLTREFVEEDMDGRDEDNVFGLVDAGIDEPCPRRRLISLSRTLIHRCCSS